VVPRPRANPSKDGDAKLRDYDPELGHVSRAAERSMGISMNKHPWDRTRLRHAPTPETAPALVKDPILAFGSFSVSKHESWLIAFVAMVLALAHFADSRYEHESVKAMTEHGMRTISIDVKRSRATSVKVDGTVSTPLKQ
jgi:hypothetical protein